MLRILRRLVILLLLAAIFTALGYLIVTENNKRINEVYQLRVTIAVETAVANALYDATRVAESDLRQYRLVVLEPGQPLDEVAAQYDTTVEVLRLANGLLPEVEFGNGETVIVPQGVTRLEPPRRFILHRAVDGDTLATLATFYDVPLELLQFDNPVLTERGLIPGDTVFIPDLLS